MSPRVSRSVPATDPFVSGPLGSNRFTDEEIREFQRLAKEHAGADLSEAEAHDVAKRLLRTLVIVRDVTVKAAEPSKPDRDTRELTLHLRKLQHELELTASHPSSWRWAVMTLHEAMRLTFALSTPPAPDDQPLPLRFDPLTDERPELPQVRPAIDLLERLRTKCTSLGVLRWPVGRGRLRAMCSDCLRVIQRLEPETGTDIEHLEDVLQELG